RVPDNFEKGARLALLVRRQFLMLRCQRVRVAILRQGAQGTNAHENESDHGTLKLRPELSDFHVNSGHPRCTHLTYLLLSNRCSSSLRIFLTASAETAFC